MFDRMRAHSPAPIPDYLLPFHSQRELKIDPSLFTASQIVSAEVVKADVPGAKTEVRRSTRNQMLMDVS